MPHHVRTLLTASLSMLVLTVAASSSSADEPALLKGEVIALSGDSLKKVSVVLTSVDDPAIRLAAKTDKTGRFEISVEHSTSSYRALLEKKGYAGLEAMLDFEAGETVDITFTMLTDEELADGKDVRVEQRISQETDPAAALYNEGATAFNEGDLETARAKFEGALEHDPSMPQALTALCVVTTQLGAWEDVLQYADRILAVDANDLRALFAAYRAHKHLGHDEEAAATAQTLRATGHSGDAAVQTFNEGVDLFQEKKVDEAVKLFEQAAELDPSMVDAHAVLAGLYVNRSEFDKAIEASERALALAPDNVKALTYRFEASLRSDDERLPEAIEALAAIDPEYVSKAVNALALDRFEQNRYDESKKLVAQLLELDPADARANYIMGLILVNAGDNAAAIGHLQAFVDATPNDPDAAVANSMIEALK